MFYNDETTAEALEAHHEQQREVDAEMKLMEEQADALHAHEQRGYCTHQSAVAYRFPPIYVEQADLMLGEYRCTNGCRTVFPNEKAFDEAAHDPFTTPVTRTVRPGAHVITVPIALSRLTTATGIAWLLVNMPDGEALRTALRKATEKTPELGAALTHYDRHKATD
ncbi:MULTISPECIES: hypothetical protein [unclassified Streptomyces]|uniref:hypothetical protein n=1 Tax=unclassified Streptomyces TaxID=2593676 RepID=UPI0033D472BA